MLAPSWHGGYPMRRRNFGILPKCPYCDKTDIPMRTAIQVTCGGYDCRAARCLVIAARNRKKKKP